MSRLEVLVIPKNFTIDSLYSDTSIVNKINKLEEYILVDENSKCIQLITNDIKIPTESFNFTTSIIGDVPENEGIKFHDFGKPVHIRRKNILLLNLPPESKAYNYLLKGNEEDCIAFKQHGKWGFLYYSVDKSKNYTFRFEPVSNVRNNKKLTEAQYGYRDFVYFIRAEALPKSIKIGRAEDPDKRFRQLVGANHRPLTRLVVMPDGRMEKVWHSKFSYLQYKGDEWFEIGDELMEFIETEKRKYKVVSTKYKEAHEF